MKAVVSCFDVKTIQKAIDLKECDFIFHLQGLSKKGSIPIDIAKKYLGVYQKENKVVAIQIDRLFLQRTIDQLEQLNPFLEENIAFRIEDPGVGLFLINQKKTVTLQLILNYHSKTATSWHQWQKLFGKNLERLILSSEICKSDLYSQIKSVTKTIPKLKFEILAAGKIPLYYSIRDFNIGDGQYWLQHKEKADVLPLQFMIGEQNSTIYHGSELFIADLYHDLIECNLDYYRFELSSEDQYIGFKDFISQKITADQLKTRWSKNTTYGFFRANKSDRPLKLIKNRYLFEDDQNEIGSVIESIKNYRCLIKLDRSIKLPLKIRIISPEGHNIDYNCQSILDIYNQKLTKTVKMGYYTIPWQKGLSSKSKIIIYKDK